MQTCTHRLWSLAAAMLAFSTTGFGADHLDGPAVRNDPAAFLSPAAPPFRTAATPFEALSEVKMNVPREGGRCESS